MIQIGKRRSSKVQFLHVSPRPAFKQRVFLLWAIPC